MSTIVWCPLCITKLVSHMPHGLVPPHDYPTAQGTLCPGVNQVGLTGAGVR